MSVPKRYQANAHILDRYLQANDEPIRAKLKSFSNEAGEVEKGKVAEFIVALASVQSLLFLFDREESKETAQSSTEPNLPIRPDAPNEALLK